MLKYIVAVLCPPAAMALAHKPFQAGLAVALLVLAAATWSTGLGAALLAALILWACRVVGDAEADEETRGFLRAFNGRVEPK